MGDRSNSPSGAEGVAVMNEVSKEFNRSLSLSNNTVPIAKVNEIHPSTDVINGDEQEVPAASKVSDEDEPSSEMLGKETESKTVRKFIAPKDFELLKVIGMGAFGKVLQVRNRHSAKIFAMKVISKRLIKRKGSYVENILAERNILSKIANYPFIVTMHASFQTKEKLFIIMDFCAGGELFLKLGREGHFRESTAAFYLAEITLALEHLHSVNVLHRDLKPENILLGSDGHCCLTDFGLAKDFTGSGDNEDERARTLCGTMEYMAPEMVARKWYGKGADFWSLGCIAYEMLSGLPPFSSKKGSKELFKKIMNERIRMPDGASSGTCKLLKGLLNRDVGKRLGAAKGTMFEMGGVGALKQQPFFSGLDWGKLELKEINPPEDFSVENDEDLRHFHDEYVKMTLPRSVKEISKLDFLPRHCESKNFRGFSFISDNFPLPERSPSEQEHYWNNVDADGQSLSECASSAFNDDLGEIPTPEPTPEKKKRPRRKKKKKQQPVPPLEITDEDGEVKKHVVDMKESDSKENAEATAHPEKKNHLSSNGAQSVVALNKRKNSIQPSKMKESKKKPQSKFVNDTSANSLAKSLNPNAKTWNLPTKLEPQASTLRQVAAPQAMQLQRKPFRTPPYSPTPGTWVSVEVEKAKPNGIQNKAKPTPRTPISAATPNDDHLSKTTTGSTSGNLQSPSTPLSLDWRTHIVSPHRKVLTPKNMIMQDLIPPPPISYQLAAQNAWPSLGDFPPPPGAKSKEPKLSKPMGAWDKAS